MLRMAFLLFSSMASLSLDTTSGIRLHLDRTLSTQRTEFLPAADEEVSSGSALAQQSSQVPRRPWTVLTTVG